MLSRDEKQQVKKWLNAAYKAAASFNGSEASEDRLFKPLNLFDAFVRAHANDNDNDQVQDSALEQKVSKNAFPNHPIDMPTTVDEFLGIASELYDFLKHTGNESDVWKILENAGAVVSQVEKTFVKTDEGRLKEAGKLDANAYEVRTEPRLAILIAHLRNDGVNGQSIYMDDLVITRGSVDKNMMRERPYCLLQIPRLDMEIAVCNQIGETTFVKKGTVGIEFWEHLSKDQLKARDDVQNIDRRSDEVWWSEISAFLAGQAEPAAKKVKVGSWSKRPPKLDIQLVKDSFLAHRQATEKWLSEGTKAPGGKKGSYVLEYGPYAGQLKVANLGAALAKGSRGLPGGSSIAKLNAEISAEHDLDYVNDKNLEPLDLGKIKESLLAHRQAAGEWLPNSAKAPDGKRGSYVLEHGPYAGQITVSALDAALSRGNRGLPGGSSIAQLNAELSAEHDLDYVNHKDQEPLDLQKIKKSFLAHREATGKWLSITAKVPGGKTGSYVLEHGPYAGETTISALDTCLSQGLRGLSGGSSIAQINAEISEEYDLDYCNHLDLEPLDLGKIKESLLAHRQETGEWLSGNKKAPSKESSYVLEHGHYAGQITVSALDTALSNGNRGLPGGSSIAQLNAELSAEHGLDYVNHKDQEPLDLEKIKASLLAHRQATGEWLKEDKKAPGGKPGSYVLEHGLYAGQLAASVLKSALSNGNRGLPRGSSIAKLNAEIRAALEQNHTPDFDVT